MENVERLLSPKTARHNEKNIYVDSCHYYKLTEKQRGDPAGKVYIIGEAPQHIKLY